MSSAKMRCHTSVIILSFFLVAIGFVNADSKQLGWKSGWQPADTSQTDQLAADGLLNLAAYELDSHVQANCSLADAALRREWSDLLPWERKAYTDAILCLQSKPSRIATTNSSLAPGAKSRYDDFVAVHINNTFSIHATANFLSWHRLFTWSFEQALKDECGYQSYQPYWNWGKTAFDPINSPMFDGSDYSMSGNGIYELHNCTNALSSNATPPVNCIPPGLGGGCVLTGPFKEYTVNLAPVFPSLAESGLVGDFSAPLGYEPRCLKRDISVWVSSNWTTDLDSHALITENNDIYWFQSIMQGNGFEGGFFGVHAGGHYTIGGDPGGDFFASPGDPAFFLHHAQIDRTWWIWQNQDLANRLEVISGTHSIWNNPPTKNGTLDDWLEMGILGTGTEIRNVVQTTKGQLCYVYV